MFHLLLFIGIAAVILPVATGYLGLLESKYLLTGLTVATMAIGLLSYPIAHHIAQRGAIGGYHQFLNGSLVATNVSKTACGKDGSCHHEYSCDPEIVTEVVPDADGKGTHVEVHTEWHDCPYATEEFTYTVTDSIGGEHTIANHIFAAHPREWRSGEGLPGDVPRGVPSLWKAAKEGIEQGNALPITLPSKYDNYILADQHTILKVSSDDIAALTKRKLLPEHTRNLHNPFYDMFSADKMRFVGFTPSNAADWQRALMYFNAAFGMMLRGDLHVVAIKASALPASVNQHSYLRALKAYWLNDFGKYALPKNGVVLVLGVDDSGTSVVWSEADTGMPIGNGAMLEALTSLSGQPFTVDALFGSTTAKVVIKKGQPNADYTVGNGRIPQTMMVEYPFARACMKCADKSEANQQGFTYLSTDIPLAGAAFVWTVVVDYLLILIMWGVAIMATVPTDSYGQFQPRKKRDKHKHDDFAPRRLRFRQYS